MSSVGEEDGGAYEAQKDLRRRQRSALPGDAAMGMDSPLAGAAAPVTLSGIHGTVDPRGAGPRGESAAAVHGERRQQREAPRRQVSSVRRGGAWRRGRAGSAPLEPSWWSPVRTI